MKAKDIRIEFDGRDETVIGTASGTGIKLVEGANSQRRKYYCTTCSKKIHCYVTVDKKTKEAVFHDKCKNQECECRCRTHYECISCGLLHPHGQTYCTAQKDPMERKPNPELDALIDRLNQTAAAARNKRSI